MRAVVVREYGPPGSHRIEELPSRPPGAGEVRIAVRAVGVNFPDGLVARNQYQVRPPRPFSPGKEAAGVVEAVGPGVRELRPGDRVLALVEYGAYAEELVAPAALCHRMPDGVSFVEAASLGLAFQTAHFALLERGGYRPGEVVLVTGASGAVGQASVQLAKTAGAVVLAGVRNRAHAVLARANGADHVVDLGAPDLREALKNEVRPLTGGRGADVILDQVGGDVFDACLRALAWRGRLVVVGFAAGRIPEAKANYLLVKNVAVLGCQWSDYRDRDPSWVARVQQELFGLALERKLTMRVVEEHPFDAFATALDRVERGLVHGKAVLTMGRTR